MEAIGLSVDGMWNVKGLRKQDDSKVLAELMEGGHGRTETGRLWVGLFRGKI